MSEIRKFESGATRNSDANKLDYEGFYSPLVMQAFAIYMHENRYLEDGTIRDSDNWQDGLPLDTCMKSGFRHFMDWFLEHDGYESREGIVKALCGLIFNAQSYLLTVLEEKEKSEEFVKNLLTPTVEDNPSEMSETIKINSEQLRQLNNAYPPPPQPNEERYVVPEGVEEISEKPTILSTLKRLGLKLK